MSDFESKDAFGDFVRTVRSERRFIFDGKAGNFIAAVRAASKSRMHSVKSGVRLWRAQRGSLFAPENDMGIEEEHPLPVTRMIPDPKYIKNGGRANPPGFTYLYLASTKETALAEMRPWVGESLTLGIFEIQKNIKIVVCKAGDEDWEERLFVENPPLDKLNQYVWNDISRAFAHPVDREDQENTYVPTQILAEAFKAEGFDGFAYRSGLERGTNIVLFDVHAAKLIDRCRFVYTLNKVRYNFEASPNHPIRFYKDGAGECITEIPTESP